LNIPFELLIVIDGTLGDIIRVVSDAEFAVLLLIINWGFLEVSAGVAVEKKTRTKFKKVEPEGF
jgi:hypothetical protein